MDKTCLVEELTPGLLQALPEMPCDLFPLPLSAFEKYLIWDETPEQPMHSFIELHFLQPLQTSIMESALNWAARIHPIFNCFVDEQNGELRWIYHPDYRHRLHCESQSPVLANGRPMEIDLSSHPGVRFWYRQAEPMNPPASTASGVHDAGSRILIQLHHATSDGVGLRRFLIDAMTIYAQCTSPKNINSELRPPWSKIDLGLLKRRADLSDAFGGPPSKPLTAWQRLKNAHYFHFQLPKPLATFQTEKKPLSLADESEPLEHLIIDRETSEAILEHARLKQVGINELALGLLFETCCIWNQQHGDRNPRSRIRILMPYDLRSRIDLRMPATNRLSFSFLGRRQDQCGDLNELVRSIHAEIQCMKQSQLPLDFVTALEAASRYPQAMRWIIRRSRNMATAVLTYAGDVSRGMQKYFPEQNGTRIVGDVHLDKILAAPPVRHNTHWSLGLCINWGQLCISAAWNRDVFSRSQCIQLLELYHSRWLRWLDQK